MPSVPVPEFAGYHVHDDGRVTSDKTGKVLKPSVAGKGYLRVDLYRNNEPHPRYVHRLVAEAFVPNPLGLPQVDHRDTDKTNNAATNLVWMTNKDNTSKEHIKLHRLRAPDGSIVEFEIVREFARQNGLHRGPLNDLLLGKRKSSQGYTNI